MTLFIKYFFIFNAAIFLTATFSLAKLTSAEVKQLMVCYKTILETKPGKEKYDFAIKWMPEFNGHKGDKKLYKLFIDKERLEDPDITETKVPLHLMFDVKEPGYFQAMMNAFALMSTQIGKENNVRQIMALHDEAVRGVKDETENSPFQSGIAQGWHYGLGHNKPTPENSEELMQSQVLLIPELLKTLIPAHGFTCQREENVFAHISQGPFLSHLKRQSLYSPTDSYEYSIHSNTSGDLAEIEKLLAPYFLNYEKQIKKITTLQGKLEAISELLRALEIYHFFPDGNQRTYAFLMLNKLLLENNIPPVILNDPYMFDGLLNVKEMAKSIIKGLKNYLNDTESHQRHLLESDCKKLDLHSEYEHYLSFDSTYVPYFNKKDGKKIDKELKESLKSRVKESINQKVVNAKDSKGMTLLSHALLFKDQESIDALIKNGANLEVKDYFGYTAVDYAIYTGDVKIVRSFLDHIKLNSLHETSVLESHQIFKIPGMRVFYDEILNRVSKDPLIWTEEKVERLLQSAVDQDDAEAVQAIIRHNNDKIPSKMEGGYGISYAKKIERLLEKHKKH
jgi:ankyrin repeat protein